MPPKKKQEKQKDIECVKCVTCGQTIKPLNELELDKEHVKVKCWPCSCGRNMHTVHTVKKKDAEGSIVEESWVENFKSGFGRLFTPEKE